MSRKQDIVNHDALWDSTMKCKCGVSWKPSVKSHNLNVVERTYNMSKKFVNGTWKNGKPKEIQIQYPKKRDGLSISFQDRIYQRSINDNVLYPTISKAFILDNCACQKGKGIEFARNRLKKHLWNQYYNFGNDGYILKIDVKGYYPSMQHDKVKAKFRRYLDDDVYKMVCDVLDTQYVGDVGYAPGSQMVQIAGISLLDDLDHYCKERLHLKHYIRYMDDILIIHHDYEYLISALNGIKRKLSKLGFEVHTEKTRITPLSDGFIFLGFHYKITSTGKIIMTLNSANVRHERKKLRRLVKLAKQGKIPNSKANDCFNSWKANASKGNSHNLIRRMEQYYADLWKENFNHAN